MTDYVKVSEEEQAGAHYPYHCPTCKELIWIPEKVHRAALVAKHLLAVCFSCGKAELLNRGRQ